MRKFLPYILFFILAFAALSLLVHAQYEPAAIPKPSTLPGPDANTLETTGTRDIFTKTLLPRFAVGFIGFIGAVTLVFLIIGGVRFVTAYGNEEAIEKAKKQITWSLIAFIIALLAFTIVQVIINFEFFGNQTQQQNLDSFLTPPSAYAQNVDDLLPRPGEDKGGDIGNIYDSDELKAVANLPKVTTENIMTTIIRSILGWSMILTIAALVFAGIFYLRSMGNEEDLNKAKSIILYLIIGIAIMAAAYGIVLGISQFNFFE